MADADERSPVRGRVEFQAEAVEGAVNQAEDGPGTGDVSAIESPDAFAQRRRVGRVKCSHSGSTLLGVLSAACAMSAHEKGRPA